MANFRFKARDQQGQLQTGDIDAVNRSNAAELLSRRGFIVLEIIPLAASTPSWWQQPLWQPRVGLSELIVLSRQMHALMKASIPIIRAIRGLADSTVSKALTIVLSDLADQLEQGRPLSQAMASHPRVFNRLMISIVQVGENTGRLDEAFAQLSDYFEQEQQTRQQIKQATRYPSFVLLALVAALVIMNIFVIPQFAAMFSRFQAELPWSTQLLLSSSNFFTQYWFFLLCMLLGSAILGYRYINTDEGRYRWSRWKLQLPLMGDIINRATLGRYARSFALMLRAGVPMTTALSLVADAVDNDFMAEKIKEMRRNIERGESLVRVSAQSQLFTPLVMQMLAVGEETGQVDDMLHEVAMFYEREVAYDLKGLTAKIEPILISIVAGMVLILALGIFTPMWDMLNAYQGGGG